MPIRYSLHFTPAEVSQLLSYVNARDDGSDAGWYYGNKEQFEARHKRILEELELRQPRQPQETNGPQT